MIKESNVNMKHKWHQVTIPENSCKYQDGGVYNIKSYHRSHMREARKAHTVKNSCYQK